MTPPQSTLIIVYNAEAGMTAAILDSVHKLLSPATYPCDLCALTYGLVRMSPRWKQWLAAQEFGTRFYHRPDFRVAYPTLDIELPAILFEADGSVREIVSARAMKSIKTVDTLIEQVAYSLKTGAT
jgi:hypothetical protein